MIEDSVCFGITPLFLVTLRQPIQFKALLSTIFLSRPIQNNSIGYKFFVSSHRPQACEDERYGIREVQRERERERERENQHPTKRQCLKAQMHQLESQQRALGPMKRGSK
jgi:hypothetical protein